MASTTAGACGCEGREEMSLAQRLGGGPQSSSGDFVFAVGFLHTESRSLCWTAGKDSSLGWVGKAVACFSAPMWRQQVLRLYVFFLPGGILEVLALILDYLVLTGLLNFHF